MYNGIGLTCSRVLQLTGLWKDLNDKKPAFCEPRGTGDHFDAVMDGYYASVRAGNGGMLMAVCRGKVRFVGSKGWLCVHQSSVLGLLLCCAN